jgi:cytidine deaminase
MLGNIPPIHPPSSIPELSATYSLTPNQLQSLSTLSAAAKSLAYCPYSRFRVGATLLTTDADVRYKYISGANIENASYPVGICAERVALSKAVSELGAAREWMEGDGVGERGRAVGLGGAGGGSGYKGWKSRGNSIRALAVATDVSPPTSPCGMCRQL